MLGLRNLKKELKSNANFEKTLPENAQNNVALCNRKIP